MKYDVSLPRKIVFGWGRRAEIGPLGRRLGSRALVICGSRTLRDDGTLDALLARLRDDGIAAEHLGTITREPEVEDVDRFVCALLERTVGDDSRRSPPAPVPAGRTFLIGLGGGSAIDTAKGVAAMATNSGGRTVREFLEGVGSGLSLTEDPLPVLAIPTTAGTGTEATRNAVISSFSPPFKKSLRSERMIPELVLVDPELTVSCPPQVTAHSGMDAITQLIESFVSHRSTPFTRALCREGLVQAMRPLPRTDGRLEPAIVRVVEHPDDQECRSAMAHAALLSGVALANSGLGVAHGVAAALGVHCRVPHGLSCAVMLPVAMEVNRDTGRAMAEVGRLLTGREELNDAEATSAGIAHVRDVSARIGIPKRLREIGVPAVQLPDIAAGSAGNSLSGNPRPLSTSDLEGILRDVW
jgi:alcohol dehydrogenase class IV